MGTMKTTDTSEYVEASALNLKPSEYVHFKSPVVLVNERDEARKLCAEAAVMLRKVAGNDFLDECQECGVGREIGGKDAVEALAQRLEAASETAGPGPVIVQPVGNCDGSWLFKDDPTHPDRRGARLTEPCPGCRACK